MVENSPTWFALHVKPRHEFLVQTDLTKIDSPLFPGYLFARVLPVSDDFLGLVKARGVMRILSTVPGHPTPVPDVQIFALKTLLTSDKELDIHPELQAGKAVTIKKGPLQCVGGACPEQEINFSCR